MIGDASMAPVLRCSLILVLTGVAMAGLEWRWRVLSRFAAEEGSALNLAIARVVVIAIMIAQTHLGYTLLFAHLDPRLMVAPRGWTYIMPFIPLDPGVITVAYGAFLLAATLALVGLFGRPACAVATALVFYLQTIPQLYGKVNHTTNHLIVFGAILALAPCCDALSIDAIRSAIRRADRGEIRRSPVSRAYGFPVKAMMLMVGVAYFFPGVWKVSVAWGQWFTATNLSRLIITMLHDQPPSAFQSWMLGMPTLLFLGSVATIVFEVGFVFAILVRRLRPIAALAGLAFHNAIGLLMAIPFGSLQVCYVIFIDWRAIGARIADRRHIGPLTVVYDASCVLCRRAVGILVAFDWLDLLRPVPNTTLDRLSPVERSAIASIDPTTTFLAIDGAQVVTAGYEAYGAIARRLVLLWPMLPALASARVRRHGQRVYARVAASRACRVQDRTTPRRETVARPSIPMSLRVTCIGVLAGMCLAGAGHLVAGWPLACYPPFDKPVGPVTTEVELEATDVDGRVEDWVPSFDDPIRDRLSRERWIGLLSPFLITDRPFPEARARALIAVWQQEHAIPPIVSVRFYADSYTIAVGPERWARVQRREIGAVSVAGGTSAMRTQPARDVVARAPVNLGQSPDAG